MDREAVINELYSIGAVQFGTFRLKSGIESPIYIDLRRIVSFPKLLRKIAGLMWEGVREEPFDLILGVPYTAIPIATVMSVEFGVPMLMKRKEKKTYGTGRIIEGVYTEGQRVLVVEDLVTSGSSVMETIESLEELGLVVQDITVLIDREQGAANILSDKGYHLHSIFTLSEILTVLGKELGVDTIDKVKCFIKENQFQVEATCKQ